MTDFLPLDFGDAVAPDWQMPITGTSTATQPRYYAWWFPGSPVRVHVDLRVIERLQERLRDTVPGLPEQGLLFGRTLEGATTEILEFQPAFNRSVPEIIAELSAEPGKRKLVGYYRTGEALRLNTDDLLLFQTFFGKPYQVFLVMQPNGFAPPTATFFFSQGDHKISEFPFLEFPLDASLLATEERDRISRCRQATTDQPIAVLESLPPEPAKPRKQRRIFLRIALGVLAVAVLLLPALWFTNQPFHEQSLRVWNGIRSPLQKPQSSLPSPSPSRPRIGLQAKRQDRDLELTWDHESPAVAAAKSGAISIQDGSVKREIPLDLQQLRGESILYSPVSGQVLVQLTVTTPTGAVAESVRVIRSEDNPTHWLATPQPKPPDEPIVPVARASKTFTAPPVATHTPSTPLPLTEPPALNRNPEHPTYPASVAPALPAPSAPMPPAATPPAPTTPQASAAAIYYPPVALREIAPTFPAELKPMAFKPTLVSIRVAIDENGKVLKAEPLPQQNVHKLFVLEAVRAAMLWKFQPARRGAKPVASESILNFSFR